MIYLDTHLVVWLYEGLTNKLSKKAIQAIEENELLLSPMVLLEIQFLFEIKRINETAKHLFAELEEKINLKLCRLPLDKVVDKASALTWTRDPFDRVIVAQALARNAPLLTKDAFIRRHFKLALW